MASKFPSPAQDYAHNRISLDEVCGTQRNSVYLVRAEGGARRSLLSANTCNCGRG